MTEGENLLVLKMHKKNILKAKTFGEYKVVEAAYIQLGIEIYSDNVIAGMNAFADASEKFQKGIF